MYFKTRGRHFEESKHLGNSLTNHNQLQLLFRMLILPHHRQSWKMGEAVISSEGGMELQVRETEMASEKAAAAADASSSVVRWERFLPKMVVRVLLVEADDSTRQIIAALLRKCSYRVAAVSDGLKAWEVLRGSPCDIDLILTEVELPAISGYALLSLIMEHELCKSIPVIMMSSHDSVSTVYKCMLKGATDFLVKPIRKNELRNLWQHVWRKEVSSTLAGLQPPDESVAQKKDEAAAENNGASDNNSSRCMASIHRNRECVEKGIDVQSSFTKPESAHDGDEDAEHFRGCPQPKDTKCPSDDVKISPLEESRSQEEKNSDGCWQQAAIDDNENAVGNSSMEAIDLIGAFDNQMNAASGNSSKMNFKRFDVLPLDLSLRRSHPSGSANQVNDKRPRLNHSEGSAFSRYINKSMQPDNSTLLCDQQKDHETNSEKQVSHHNLDHSSDTYSPPPTSQKPETTFSCPPSREISHQIPVRGVRYGNTINGYDSLVPPTYCAQFESRSQVDSCHGSDSWPLNSQHAHSLVDQRDCGFIDQTENIQGKKSDNLETEELVSPGKNQSAYGSFYSGDISNHQSSCSGSNGKMNTISVIRGPSECHNEEIYRGHEGTLDRSMQREATLTKFRLKRKDRCFEKKVRYESRRKLAEQRPRVKGQFVRQVPNDPQPRKLSANKLYPVPNLELEV